MFLNFEAILLILGNALGFEVIWNDLADFDDKTIQGVNDGSIMRIELPSYRMIFPGTLWCGQGNIAPSEDFLGHFRDTDNCCRAHDLCDDIIKSGKTNYNLTNTASYTRLNCKCDLAFSECLKKVNSLLSRKMKFIYFTMLGTKCFRLDYPIIRCKATLYVPFRRCLEYEYDTNGEKVYQWFDSSIF